MIRKGLVPVIVRTKQHHLKMCKICGTLVKRRTRCRKCDKMVCGRCIRNGVCVSSSCAALPGQTKIPGVG